MKNSMIDIGGYHEDVKKRKWPPGSIWPTEGQRLYHLVKKEKPNLVVEVGAYHGCSTTWICKALIENKKGKLISIDNSTFGVAWDLVPEWCNKVLEKWDTDCFICDVPKNIDILFEDGEHSPGFTKKVLQRFPADVVAVHDYRHFNVGKYIQKDFNEVLGEPDEITNDESDCGLAIKWVNRNTVR